MQHSQRIPRRELQAQHTRVVYHLHLCETVHSHWICSDGAVNGFATIPFPGFSVRLQWRFQRSCWWTPTLSHLNTGETWRSTPSFLPQMREAKLWQARGLPRPYTGGSSGEPTARADALPSTATSLGTFRRHARAGRQAGRQAAVNSRRTCTATTRIADNNKSILQVSPGGEGSQ